MVQELLTFSWMFLCCVYTIFTQERNVQVRLALHFCSHSVSVIFLRHMKSLVLMSKTVTGFTLQGNWCSFVLGNAKTDSGCKEQMLLDLHVLRTESCRAVSCEVYQGWLTLRKGCQVLRLQGGCLHALRLWLWSINNTPYVQKRLLGALCPTMETSIVLMLAAFSEDHKNYALICCSACFASSLFVTVRCFLKTDLILTVCAGIHLSWNRNWWSVVRFFFFYWGKERKNGMFIQPSFPALLWF